MDKREELLREIAGIERDIEELLDYRSGLSVRDPALKGWPGFVSSFRRRMASRQALRHLQYLRLAREIAHSSYEDLNKADLQGTNRST